MRRSFPEFRCWSYTNVRRKYLWALPNDVSKDEGQMDMAKLMQILYDTGYKGLLRPDHVPTRPATATVFRVTAPSGPCSPWAIYAD
ncbi:MAG: hypothetical protein Q8939_00010 [Bacteroidota bacterium]|nr:hypothetical protein [Bacteroidota bacterium]